MNPHVKSYSLLGASIAGFAAFAFACGFFLLGLASPAPSETRAESLEYGIIMAAVMAPVFGFLFWAMTFEPPVVPPVKTVGWRRWRFLMWAVGLAVVLTLAVGARRGDWLAAASVGVPSGVIGAFMGWVFLSVRADRARAFDLQRRRKAFAQRLKDAILEVAKSDPYLGLEEIKAFLSKPYNAMDWLAKHGWVRPVDLHYFAGVADAVVLPETVTLEADDPAQSQDVPVLVEYVMFVQCLSALSTGEWTDEAMENVTAHIERRAGELREARLARKL